MNRDILAKEVQEFLRDNLEKQATDVALDKSPFANVSSQELAQQIEGWQKCAKKLPTWAYHPDIYYPKRIHIEQASSEHTALLKQNLIKPDSRVIDLTAGMGVDVAYFAQVSKQVVYCELNEELVEIAKYNSQTLGLDNIEFINQDSIAYLESCEDRSFDYIFVDPSRRNQGQRKFLLDECEPNILEHQELFFKKATTVLTKLSPLLDIKSLINQLDYLNKVIIVSVDGECKELLCIQVKGYIGEPSIQAIRLFKEFMQDYTFTFSEEKEAKITFGEPQDWIYIPDASLLKAGAFKSVARSFELKKLSKNTHLYTSGKRKSDFPGRTIQVLMKMTFREFKKMGKKRPIHKANVVVRNFPIKAEELQKRYKIKAGMNDYLIFTSDSKGNQWVLFGILN